MAKQILIIEDSPAHLQNFKTVFDAASHGRGLGATDTIHYIFAHQDAHERHTVVSNFPNYHACKSFEELVVEIDQIKGDKLILLDVDLRGVHSFSEGNFQLSHEVLRFYARVVNENVDSCILFYSSGLQPSINAKKLVDLGAREEAVSSIQKSPGLFEGAQAIVRAGLDLFFNCPLQAKPILLKLQALHSDYCSTQQFTIWFESLSSGRYPEGTLQWLTSDWLRDLLKRDRSTEFTISMLPLHKYFENGKILLIGVTLAEDDEWNHLLTSEFCGADDDRFTINDTKTIGGVSITHQTDVHMLLSDEMSEEVASFDIIVIGLEPEPQKAEEQFRLLTDKLKSVYTLAQTKAVSAPLPQVLAFATKNGLFLYSRLLEKEPEFRRFVHLLSDAAGSPSYADFRNTLVNALKDAVAFSLGLSFPSGVLVLDKWLAQFDEPDQPLALRLLRYFRFYSAECQRSLLEEYLKYQDTLIDDEDRVRDVWLTYLGRANKSAPAVLTLAAKTSWARGILNEERQGTLQVKSYEDLISHLTRHADDSTKSHGLDIYLIDDVIGSGGQLVSYADKFLNKHLISEFRALGKEDRWRNLLQAMSEGFPNELVRLHALFVIGVESQELEARFEGWNTVQTSSPTLVNTRSLKGVLKIPVRTHADHSDASIRLRVHIIDYTRSLFGLCRTDALPSSAANSLLLRYMHITKPRSKEHWLQFEPFGWKECGALISTHLNCPANTLPIIWGDAGERPWQPLFPRYFNPWDDGGKNADEVVRILNSDPEFQGDWTRRVTAYVLSSLTGESSEEIAIRLGLSSLDVQTVIGEENNKLIGDESYREKVRPIFVRLS